MQRRLPEADSGPETETLTATLVRYSDRSDRLTVHPTGVDDVTLMARWLTADAGAFVDLDGAR